MTSSVKPEPGSRAGRKRRLWRVWRRARWPFVVCLLVLAWTLGYFGYRQTGKVESPAYAALQLFALEGSQELDPPLLLTLARFLAPVAAAWVVLLTLLTVLGERLELLILRLLARNHVVVLGVGELGERLAKAFAAKGRVVVVDANPTTVAIDRCRDAGVAVVKGDAGSPSALGRANVHRARLLFVTCGNDQVNLDVAVRAARAVDRGHLDRLTAYVHLDDVGLWRLLKAEALATPATFPFAIEFFNVLDEGARGLLREHPPFESSPGGETRRPHVVVVGVDGIGERVVGHLARLWQTSAPHPEEALRITIAGPDASAQVVGLLARCPGLGDLCRLEAYPIDLAGSEIAGAPQHEPLLGVTAAYVCLGQDTQALATALALRAHIRRPGVPIVIAVQDDHSAVARLVAGGADDVTAFGTLTYALAPETVLRGTVETIAETMHRTYLNTQLARGERPGARPSLVPWSELSDALKQSNRRFAEGVGEKLEAVGCALVPAPIAGPAGLFSFSEPEVERLAQLEHHRWDRDLRRDGWQPTTGDRDDARKLHPLVGVPWKKLSEANREKDRVAVRELPAMLAAAGFVIYRLSGPDPVPSGEATSEPRLRATARAK